ncbi:hypothetical protein [uncultured Draconibacterium sp.]|uniref:hypothetical protein n=1 Tax=uncultured Draconibacterium sp. TaxID=1573823 RepID=UPI002AA7752E|nr:hypothetical protein [uncultured Draconibacterium sp.]
MKTLQKHERLLIIAAGILLLSILLMIIISPAIYTKTLLNTNNIGALIGMSLAVLIRLPLFVGYLLIVRRIRRYGDRRTGSYYVIGGFLILFALIYTDGAVAFWDNKDVIYISILMFASVFLELAAAVITFIAAYFRPKKLIKPHHSQ